MDSGDGRDSSDGRDNSDSTGTVVTLGIVTVGTVVTLGTVVTVVWDIPLYRDQGLLYCVPISESQLSEVPLNVHVNLCSV